MQISCERCSTSYVLDDALIPAQGAPVQCTRCGLVFTARPSTAAPAPVTNPHTNTAMFGAVSVPSGGPPAPAHNTAMFGAVTVPQSAGSTLPGLGGAKPNQTLIFGGATGAQPSKPPSTALFGALPSTPAQPNPNATLPFGTRPPAPQAPAPQPSPSSTLMFGAVGPQPAAPLTEPAAPRPSPSSTQMFGAVGTQAAPQQPSAPQPGPSATLLFAGQGAPPPNGNPSSTLMFGALGSQPAPAQPAPRPSPSSTMMFGAAPVPPAPQPQPEAPKPSPSSTMMFGALGSQPAPQAQPQAPKPSPSSTQMFGAVGAQPAPQPQAPKPSSTMMFGAASAASWQAPPPSDPTFSPQGSPAPEPAPVPLARPKQPSRAVTGPVGKLPGAPVPFPQPLAVGDDDEALARRLQSRNRNLVSAVVVLALLGGLGGTGWWYVHRPKPPPQELVQKTAELFKDLELDTPGSLQQAQKGYQSLAAVSPPDYVAPKANEMIALAFQAADVRAQAYALQAEFAALEREHKKADQDHARADWRTVVNDLVDRMKAVKATLDPLQDQANQLDAQQSKLLRELSDARNKLNGSTPELDRALGVYYAFKGSAENADRFSKAYAQRGLHDGWAELIQAAAADQSRQTEDTLRAGAKAAQAALAANPRLTRAKRVLAELQVQLKDYTGARATAAELSLSPDDPRVKVLQGSIDAAEKGAPASP